MTIAIYKACRQAPSAEALVVDVPEEWHQDAGPKGKEDALRELKSLQCSASTSSLFSVTSLQTIR